MQVVTPPRLLGGPYEPMTKSPPINLIYCPARRMDIVAAPIAANNIHG